MGLFKFIKSVREEMKKLDNYKKMSVEELRELSDEDLREALSERLIAEEDRNAWEVSECVRGFKGAKRIYYVVNYFDMEVQNGGLCQFFCEFQQRCCTLYSQMSANNRCCKL